MEEKIIKIDNTNYLTLSGDYKTHIKIAKGTAYLYLVEKLAENKTGARHEIKTFYEGEICLNLPQSEKYAFILTGGYDTKIEFLEVPSEEVEQNKQESFDFFQKEISNFEEKTEYENIISINQQKLSQDIYSQTLEEISSVVNRKERGQICCSLDVSPVAKVFKIICDRLGLHLNENLIKNYALTKSGIMSFAKDHTIRIREVALRNKWYKEDNGDLIAFYNPEGKIILENYDINEENGLVLVALTKKSPSAPYMMIDPESNTKKIVTDEIAARIYPMAFMAYRAFDDEKITLKSLCSFVFTYIKADIFRYVFIGFICTVIGLITPYITKNFVDQVIPQAAKNTAIQICLVVFITNIAAMVGSFARYFANLRMESRADYDLQSAVIDRLLKLHVDFFKKFSSGELSARILSISTIQKKIFNIILGCFTNFIFSFVYLIQEFRFCGYFAKWGVLFCFVPLGLSIATSFISYKWQKLILDCQGKIQGLLFQIINGIEKINVSNSHNQVFRVWTKEFIRQSKFGYKMMTISNVTSLISSLFPTIVSILFYALFGYSVAHKKLEGLSTGTFMAFFSAYGSFQGAFLGLANSLLSIREIIPIYKRVKPLLNEVPEITEAKPYVNHLNGKIEVNHINFRYSEESPLVLKDVSMEINPGEFVAIVGTSGAGKSTLLRILLGFEFPESGSVYYDDIDINSVDIGSLRSQMGVVLQNDTVLSGSILQNIVGSSGLKEEDAWKIAKKVAFDKDIEQMPMGMFTIIPAGGSTLSGGQLQRLIIARALIKNPNLLIFDEATSSLDNFTQDEIRKSLDELKITRIIIAHRLSTIVNADKIYVMDNGKIVESGTYDSLMAQDGYFASLARRQKL